VLRVYNVSSSESTFRTVSDYRSLHSINHTPLKSASLAEKSTDKWHLVHDLPCGEGIWWCPCPAMHAANSHNTCELCSSPCHALSQLYVSHQGVASEHQFVIGLATVH